MRILITLAFLVLIASAFKIENRLRDPQACIEQKCPNQWATCQKDDKCTPALQDCQKKCGVKQSCWEICLAGKHDQAAVDVAKCAAANDCLTETRLAVILKTPQECIEKYCKDEEQTCEHDRGCVRTLDECAHKCHKDDACWKQCLTDHKNTNATVYIKCIVDHDCMNQVEKVSTAVALRDPQACIEAKCPTQWAACLKDPKCQPALDDCMKKCGSKVSCWTLCLPSKGSQAAIDVAKCAQANDCLSDATETALAVFTPQDCIKEKCPSEAGACSKDPACLRALQDCEHECNDNQTCWSNCIAKKGSPTASTFWKCVLDNDCLNQVDVKADPTPHDCLVNKCPDQWKACENDDRCIPTIHDCSKRCGDKAPCWNLCLGGHKDQSAIDVMKCGVEKGCFNSSVHKTVETALAVFTPQDCIKEKCPSEAGACSKDPACLRALQDCEHECNDNQTCWSNCIAKKGSPTASTFWKCVVDNDCLNAVEKAVATIADPQACIEAKCPNQWAACQKDSKCVPTLQKCQSKCGVKQTCWELCLAGEKDSAATDVAKCAAANGCLTETRVVLAADPQECIEKYCKAEEQACENDRRCILTIEYCDKKCNTTESCWKECLQKAKEINADRYLGCLVKNHCITPTARLHQKMSKNADPIDCVKEKCPNEYSACVKDSKCEPTLDKCSKKCGTGKSCWEFCLAGADSATVNVAKCAAAQHCVGGPRRNHPFRR